jgi:hypothetical protein
MRKQANKEWFDEDCAKVNEEKNAARERAIQTKTRGANNAFKLQTTNLQNNCSESFETRQGLRQGDVLSTLLLNPVLEVIVRRANLQTTGTAQTSAIEQYFTPDKLHDSQDLDPPSPALRQ